MLQSSLSPVNRINITEHLVIYELEMIGKTLVDTVNVDNWRFQFTMTREQHRQFRSYAVPLIKKVFKCNKTNAENTFIWFWKNLGLRIKG